MLIARPLVRICNYGYLSRSFLEIRLLSANCELNKFDWKYKCFWRALARGRNRTLYLLAEALRRYETHTGQSKYQPPPLLNHILTASERLLT
jgi:hypothetical protein